MNINIDTRDLSRIEVIGDRLLILPKEPNTTTNSGLILPPSVQEKEQVLSGYVIKVGPGYPIPNLEVEDSWKPNASNIKYIPLQISEGDEAVFVQSRCFEIMFNNQRYLIVAQSDVLMVVKGDFE